MDPAGLQAYHMLSRNIPYTANIPVPQSVQCKFCNDHLILVLATILTSLQSTQVLTDLTIDLYRYRTSTCTVQTGSLPHIN